MAPVGLKYVVSFSSQDDNHKVHNLLSSDGFKRWLSHPKEKSGQMEAILQLEEPSQLAYIDIGCHWCASVEIKVGQSDWPQNQLYRTLLPTSTLLTPNECKMGAGFVKTRMFTADNFASDVAADKWDRVKLILRQPYRKDVQYGLSFIRMKTPGSKVTTKDQDNPKRGTESLALTKSVTSIQKHFFGSQTDSSKESPDPVKSRLMKIARSTENGSEQSGILSRTAKLVLSASEATGKYSPRAHMKTNTTRVQLFSESLAQKYGTSFEEELQDFLGSLQMDDIDLDNVTVADLRHKFEKRKKRKLSVEEKKVFMEKCSNYICSLFDAQDNQELPPLDQELPPLDMMERNREKQLTTPNISQKRRSDNQIENSPAKVRRKETESVKSTLNTPISNKKATISNTLISNKKAAISNTPISNKKAAISNTPISNKRAATSNTPISNKKAGRTTAKQFVNEEKSSTAANNNSVTNRVPFANKGENKSVTPKLARKGRGSKKVTSTPDRAYTCGLWLSKEGGGNEDQGGQLSNPAASRGRHLSGGRPGPQSGSYVYCSSCRGNVPEHIYRDHLISCNHGNKETHPSALAASDHPSMTANTSGDSDVIFTSENTSTCSNSDVIFTGGDTNQDVIFSGDDMNLVECPLCGDFFSADVISVHADACARAMEM